MNEPIERQKLELEKVNIKLTVLEQQEERYKGKSSIGILLFLFCVEACSVFGLVYYHSQQEERSEQERLAIAIAASCIPVALTSAACFAIADKYGIPQEQKRLQAKYLSLLERDESVSASLPPTSGENPPS